MFFSPFDYLSSSIIGVYHLMVFETNPFMASYKSAPIAARFWLVRFTFLYSKFLQISAAIGALLHGPPIYPFSRQSGARQHPFLALSLTRSTILAPNSRHSLAYSRVLGIWITGHPNTSDIQSNLVIGCPLFKFCLKMAQLFSIPFCVIQFVKIKLQKRQFYINIRRIVFQIDFFRRLKRRCENQTM